MDETWIMDAESEQPKKVDRRVTTLMIKFFEWWKFVQKFASYSFFIAKMATRNQKWVWYRGYKEHVDYKIIFYVNFSLLFWTFFSNNP